MLTMIIYYAYINEFYKTHSLDLAEFKSLKRAKEFTLGRYIVKAIAREKFNIIDEIVLDGKKPVFKTSKNLSFSISHSNNIVAVVFDDEPVGIDIEYVVDRDYKKIAKRYDKNFTTLKDFYIWWTAYEAQIKCPQACYFNTFELTENYICTVYSNKNIKNSQYLVKNFN